MTGVPHGRRTGSHRAIPTGRSAMHSIRILAASLLSAATLAGPASAMPTDPPHGQGLPPLVQPTAPSDAGFDWSSAVIGAAGGVGAFAIALAGAAGVHRRRYPEPRPIVTH
jgi:MYXO-CTERM domain-containing protein